MHVHTKRYSSCSIIEPVELVHQASKLGLAGIVIVEHHHIWSLEEIEELKRKTNSELLILRGQEVASSIGHLLIYGYYDELQENLAVEEILHRVHEKGGIVLMAHPFRNGSGLDKSLENLKSRFAPVDGIEVFNANQSTDENEYAMKVWETLGITGIGGSDAHSVEKVGKYATIFENTIKDESGLVAEIKAGRCKPVKYGAKV